MTLVGTVSPVGDGESQIVRDLWVDSGGLLECVRKYMNVVLTCVEVPAYHRLL
jgi:hypothetical protein